MKSKHRNSRVFTADPPPGVAAESRPVSPDRDRSNRDYVEDLLLNLSVYTKGFGCPDPFFFDGAVSSHCWDEFGSCKEWSSLFRDAESLDRIEGAMIYTGDQEREKMVLIGCRPLSVKEKQHWIAVYGSTGWGIPINVFSKILQCRQVAILHDGTASPGVSAYWLHGRGRWNVVQSGHLIGPTNLAHFGFAQAVQMATHRKTHWSVTIRFDPAAPSLRYFTDPTGLKNFFRFRDIDDGKTRRDALSHWVAHHWRESRDDPDMETYVRDYLRGRTRFSWHGLDVCVEIPPSEQDKIESLKQERREMKSYGVDRRLRGF